MNYLPLTMWNRNCCKQRCWHTNRQTKWYNLKISGFLPLAVKEFCTKFESCTIKTIWVIVSQWKCLRTNLEVPVQSNCEFMWGPKKDIQALSVTWVSVTLHWFLVRRGHTMYMHIRFCVSLPYRCYIPNLVKIDPIVFENLRCWCMSDNVWQQMSTHSKQENKKQ